MFEPFIRLYRPPFVSKPGWNGTLLPGEWRRQSEGRDDGDKLRKLSKKGDADDDFPSIRDIHRN